MVELETGAAEEEEGTIELVDMVKKMVG